MGDGLGKNSYRLRQNERDIKDNKDKPKTKKEDELEIESKSKSIESIVSIGSIGTVGSVGSVGSNNAEDNGVKKVGSGKERGDPHGDQNVGRFNSGGGEGDDGDGGDD